MKPQQTFTELMRMALQERDPAERRRLRTEARRVAADMQRKLIRERESELVSRQRFSDGQRR